MFIVNVFVLPLPTDGQVDDYQNTNVEGVYALGDACDKRVSTSRSRLVI